MWIIPCLLGKKGLKDNLNLFNGLDPLFLYGLNRQRALLKLLDLGSPVKIRYFWNFGSLLGAFCGIQIFRGLLLRMHYQKRIADAFFSVNLTIQKEVFAG
jgi:quinol-cytochrome oxidoreductase complex cytochrome b subunit